MNKSKISPLTAFLIFTIIMYVAGFLGTKSNYITFIIVVSSILISLLILLVLTLKKYNIITNYHIVYGTIGMNNAILCAVLNSIEIGRDLTQQILVLAIHIVVFISIISFLEFCFGKERHTKKTKNKRTISTSLVTLIVSLGLLMSRFLLRYNIDIRVVAGLSCGFLANTMFYVFLIYERLRKKNKTVSKDENDSRNQLD